MIELSLPEHTSHSSINSWLRCGKAFELEKIRKYPTAPAWWLLGGSAVHKATEWIDTDEWDGTPEEAFHFALFEECQDAKERWPDETTWLAAGYGARAQRYDYWAVQGPRYVAQWSNRYIPGDINWVELDVSTTLPSGILIKAYIDRVDVEHEIGLVQATDLKTGSRRPDSDQQLGIYSALLREWLRTKFGLPYVANYTIAASNYMFKDDEFHPVDVSNWTLDTVDKYAQEWLRAQEAQVYIPNRGDLCGRCSVAEACYLQSGDTPTTRLFDTMNPNYSKED